jgi:cytochrome c-type protein NapC
MAPSSLSGYDGRPRWRLCLPLIVVALIAGVMLTAAGTSVLAWTNTEAFCISCHEMRDNVFDEFKETIHDQNRTGVRATCADCHVPREFIPKMIRKVEAVRELYAHYTGKIDTPEKFEEHRYEMAKRVWTEMRRNDSQACRDCHDEAAVSEFLESERGRQRHKEGVEQGLTCIDCHFGIAHIEPEGELTPQDLGVTIQK